MNKNIIAIACFLAFALFLSGCTKTEVEKSNSSDTGQQTAGNDAGGKTDDTGTAEDTGGEGEGEVTPKITFEPEEGNKSASIWLELVSADAEARKVTLRVVGDGLDNVYGVAGRLIFDRSILVLDSAELGTALEGDEAVLTFAATSNEKGAIFGFSRSVQFRTAVTLTSDKTIGLLHFSALDKGTTTITFNKMLSGCLNQEMDRVEVKNWLGGAITVK